MTVAAAAAGRGVHIAWHPFLLGPLFQRQQGLTDSPFNAFPDKGRYMWRDMERCCAALGLPLQRPDVFPRNSLLAARVVLVGARDGWISRFSPAVYAANFAANRDIADPDVLAPLIAAAGAVPCAVLEEAASEAIKQRLRSTPNTAMTLGLFGAPSFVTGDGEIFWGHDRMDAATAWAATHTTER
jgi:2-hydroxychromene-2-carboxylate isomerase